jgi:hypothetical protein
MSSICLIDTSIFLNFLNVPNCNQSREKVIQDFKDYTDAEISTWLEKFPDLAGQNKSPNKYEGTSFGDLSIIQDFEKTCKKFPMSDVFIWSLDQDLASYRQNGK